LRRLEFDTKQFDDLLQWAEEASLARKLLGVSASLEKNKSDWIREHMATLKTNSAEETLNKKEPSRHGLYTVVSFLSSVHSETSADSRIIYESSKECYQYLLLNASNVFADIAEKPRSLIIAGGTMKPLESFILQLLPNIDRDRIKFFSCGHIVNVKKQLLPICLGVGPSDKLLDYRFGTRESPDLIQETYRTISSMSRLIPNGLVIFFPSYKLLQVYKSKWNTEKIHKKPILTEPKTSSECEKILTQYSRYCENHGAVLLAVIGGKLAEGINFNDHLGRAVVVIGQPFPDIKSPILQEKLKYLKEKNDSSNYAHTLCWRAINQSIGRVIRHQNDYACIVLLDQRYVTNKNSLPDWIESNTQITTKFSTAFVKVRNFFKQFQVSTEE